MGPLGGVGCWPEAGLADPTTGPLTCAEEGGIPPGGAPCRERENAFILAMMSWFRPLDCAPIDAGGREGLMPPRRAALIWPSGVDEAAMPLEASGPGRSEGTLAREAAGAAGDDAPDESDRWSTSGDVGDLSATGSCLFAILLETDRRRRNTTCARCCAASATPRAGQRNRVRPHMNEGNPSASDAAWSRKGMVFFFRDTFDGGWQGVREIFPRAAEGRMQPARGTPLSGQDGARNRENPAAGRRTQRRPGWQRRRETSCGSSGRERTRRGGERSRRSEAAGRRF